jgi:hypothetical protein
VFPEAPLPLRALLPPAVGRRVASRDRAARPQRADERAVPGSIASPHILTPGTEPAAAGTER